MVSNPRYTLVFDYKYVIDLWYSYGAGVMWLDMYGISIGYNWESDTVTIKIFGYDFTITDFDLISEILDVLQHIIQASKVVENDC